MSRQGRKRKPAFYALIAGVAVVLVAALVLVLVLWPGNDGAFGETLHLTGQVWVWDWDSGYTQFTGTRTLTSNLGGAGGIIGGRLDFTVGRPADEDLESIMTLVEDFESEMWRVSASPAAARFVWLEMLLPNGELYRGYQIETETSAGRSFERSHMFYIFVDQNVTFSAEGRTETGIWEGRIYTAIQEAFNINLREGWNALHYRQESTWTETGYTQIRSLSRAAPDYVKWVLWE